MIPFQLRVSLLIALAVFFFIVVTLLKKKRLALKYTLLWLLTVAVLLILVIFPELMVMISGLIGTQSVMNTLYVMLIAFILMLILMLTSIVSKQTERIASLAQSNALLEKRIRELEAKQNIDNSMIQKSGYLQTTASSGEAEGDV